MLPHEFVNKWSRANLKESAASQEHFLDLCRLLDHPTPAEADAEGSSFTFEKGAKKNAGGNGFADVWKHEFFAWEYKGRQRSLAAAYQQLLQYREDLGNPPLLIVCDLDRFEVHTNFTNTPTQVHRFATQDIAEDARALDLLRAVFFNTEKLRPGQTTLGLTEQAAAEFARLADLLRARGIQPQRAAHFLTKVIFCLFAEDVGLLPRRHFSNIAEQSSTPKEFVRYAQELFQAMAHGGRSLFKDIPYFNGNLFADGDVIELTLAELEVVRHASRFDWSSIEPAIFGTLFERSLDPSKRSQIGAHYTHPDDIRAVVEPVLMAPLRREWEEVRQKVADLSDKRVSARGNTARRLQQQMHSALLGFLERLARVRVLDPACGSGNFLYISMNLLKDLEKEVITFAGQVGLTLPLYQVTPGQLYGLEINPYAQELAQTAIWIGYIQWHQKNGFPVRQNPVLDPLDTIRNTDAILDVSDPASPIEPDWPEADVIVGNPPFLGGKLLRRRLGDEYVEALFSTYKGIVQRNADLCCYWFEKSRAMIESGQVSRVGLLATQGIRGGASQETLKRIKATGDIFFAVADKNWILDGATVHVSMIGFDDGTQTERFLDGNVVRQIHANLRSGTDITQARRLHENLGLAFQGVTPMGPFEISRSVAVQLLQSRGNPNGSPNSDVVRRWANGKDFIEGRVDSWIVDFGCATSKQVASLYQDPFEYVKQHVLPAREEGETEEAVEIFWLHWRPRPQMRNAIDHAKLDRFIVTPRVSKHRLFIWVSKDWLPSDATVAFATDDDYVFGILHSKVHELWARAKGTQLREAESGFRYTPQTCLETFPFPHCTTEEGVVIAEAARELDRLRWSWLNPAEWTHEEVMEFPGSVNGPWAHYLSNCDMHGIGTVQYPVRVPNSEAVARELAQRTLTNLYNARPTWLAQLHERLDKAVLDAYGWPPDTSDDEILASLLTLNLEREPV